MTNYNHIELLKNIQPDQNLDLLRLGRESDGGYVLGKVVIDTCDALISIGINNEWSFEKAILKEKRIPVVMVDDHLSAKINAITLLRSILGLLKLNNSNQRIKVIRYFYNLNFNYWQINLSKGLKISYNMKRVSNENNKNQTLQSKLIDISTTNNYAYHYTSFSLRKLYRISLESCKKHY